MDVGMSLMLTEAEIRELLAKYIPPYHQHIRDKIYEKIIACGEQVLASVQPIFDDISIKDRQLALLEKALWQIGGNSIKDFFIERAEYNPSIRAYIKALPREKLLHLRKTKPELLKEVFNFLSEDIVAFCAAHQHQMQDELQQLGLTVPEQSFDINKEHQLNPHLIKDCPICGKSPTKQPWLYVWTPNNDWQNMRGRAGWMSVCADCNIQVSWLVRELN
jgi:hypothetical protein